MQTKAREVFLRFTVRSAADVPPVIGKFSDGLDAKEGLQLYRDGEEREPGVKVYDDTLVARSVGEFVAAMECEYTLVLAWYEQKVVRCPTKKDPDRTRTFHNVVYLWVINEDAKAYHRFAPRRPAIRKELNDAILANAVWDVRTFWDNPRMLNEGAGPIDPDWRRWEISLNNDQWAQDGEEYISFPFVGANLSAPTQATDVAAKSA